MSDFCLFLKDIWDWLGKESTERALGTILAVIAGGAAIYAWRKSRKLNNVTHIHYHFHQGDMGPTRYDEPE